MLTDPNQPPGNRGAATGVPSQAGTTPVPASQTGWLTRFNVRRLSHKDLRHLGVLWGLLILLCLPVTFLAPNWLYIVAAIGIYRVAYLAGFDIKFKPGKLLRKILVGLIFMALVLWVIRSETNKFAGREVITPPNPVTTEVPAQLKSPAPVRFHP